MSDLSAKSRGLLDAARSARPTSAARERMGAALAARIGVIAIGAPPGPSAPVPAPGAPVPAPGPPLVVPPIVPAPLAGVAAAMATAKAIVIGAVLGGISVGAVAVWPDHSQPTPAPMRSVAAPSSSVARAMESAAPVTPSASAAPSAEVAKVAEVAEVAEVAKVAEVATAPFPEAPRGVEIAAPAREHAPAPRAVVSVEATEARGSADSVAQHSAPRAVALNEAPTPPVGAISLGEETASLAEAQRSLKQGDGARAVAVLDELAARHPTGVMREERLAARVFALCAAGRVEEAREAGQRFLAELPASVQADRVRASCAFAPGKPR